MKMPSDIPSLHASSPFSSPVCHLFNDESGYFYHIPIPCIITDREGRIRQINRRSATLFRFAAPPFGKLLVDFVQDRSAFINFLQGDDAMPPLQLGCRTPGGIQKYEISKQPFEEGGEPLIALSFSPVAHDAVEDPAILDAIVGSIAHAWRQPVNVIAILTQILSLKYRSETLDDTYFDEWSHNIDEQIGELSRTIEDFRLLFRNDGTVHRTRLRDLVVNVQHLVETRLEHHHITLHVRVPESLQITCAIAPFQQLLLGMLTRFKDIAEVPGALIVDATDHAETVAVILRLESHEAEKTIREPDLGTLNAGIRHHLKGSVQVSNGPGKLEVALVLPQTP